MAETVTDREIAKNLGTCSLGELAWTFQCYRGKSPHIYTILACHPWLSEERRGIALDTRREEIKEKLSQVDRESLDIQIDRDGKKVSYSAEQFVQVRDRIAQQLHISIFAEV